MENKTQTKGLLKGSSPWGRWGGALEALIKDWTLPISMVIGSVSYVLFRDVTALAPLKEILVWIIPYLLPALVFAMLFLSFCKIDIRDLKPRPWQLWLILIQIAEVAVMTWWCITNRDSEYLILGESMLAVFISPMAAVGAVVTNKIGGNAATATTYTVISSLFTAIAVPLIYPLVEPGNGVTFFDLFLKILTRVFPTIVAPLILSIFLRFCVKPVHAYFVRIAKDKAFYMWALCTAVNTAQIIRSIVNSSATGVIVALICLVVGIIVAVQFYVGKNIGGLYSDRIAAGQGLAQKNTVLAIWIALTFLSPTASIGPGACLLWQNLVNSWQIWHHNKVVG